MNMGQMGDISIWQLVLELVMDKQFSKFLLYMDMLCPFCPLDVIDDYKEQPAIRIRPAGSFDFWGEGDTLPCTFMCMWSPCIHENGGL